MMVDFDKLVKFVEENRGSYKFELERDTELQRDLRIYGDDAYDFILEWSKIFGIDISGFNLADYFEDESGMNYFGLNTSKKKVITLGDLEAAMRAGRLAAL